LAVLPIFIYRNFSKKIKYSTWHRTCEKQGSSNSFKRKTSSNKRVQLNSGELMKSSYNYSLWKEYTATRTLQTREKLLTKYLPLVKYVTGKMMFSLPTCVDYNDLLSAGVMGLIGALERFNPEQGVKFETFVLPRIKGAILDELRTLDWAPRSLRSKARMVDSFIARSLALKRIG